MNRSRLLPLLAVGGSVALAIPGVAGAASPRAQRSVAGVRATLSAYDNAVLAGKGKTACALLTPAAQKEIAKVNHASSCEKVIVAAGELLKLNHKQAAQVSSYAAKAKVTRHGDSATVPKLNGPGTLKLTYTHGLWYISGE